MNTIKKIAIVTDTNSSISNDEAKKLGIYLVSMPFIINNKTYFDGKDLSHEEFYKLQAEDADITTSQPSPGDVMDLWDELLTKYDKIIHMPMAASLSGSCNSAKMLAADYDGKVLVVDNERVSITLRQAVLDAIKYVNEGYEAEEIKDMLERDSFETSIYLSVDTLKYLKKGGRLNPAAAMIGTALNIKPVLEFKGRGLDPYKKTRGLKAAWKEIIKAAKADLDTLYKDKNVVIAAAYSGQPEDGDKWIAYVRENLPEYEIENFSLPLSIATHTGPNGCGLACMIAK